MLILKVVNFFILWTRSKARAAQAEANRADAAASCASSRSGRRYHFKQLLHSAKRVLTTSPSVIKSYLANTVPFLNLSHVPEDSDSNCSSVQADNPLNVIETGKPESTQPCISKTAKC